MEKFKSHPRGQSQAFGVSCEEGSVVTATATFMNELRSLRAEISQFKCEPNQTAKIITKPKHEASRSDDKAKKFVRQQEKCNCCQGKDSQRKCLHCNHCGSADNSLPGTL